MVKKGSRCKFDEWLAIRFDYPTQSGHCDISSTREITYITQAFEQSGELLKAFSNDQLNQSLWYLVSSSSGIMQSLLDDRVTWSVRESCIHSFYDIFEQLFAIRCSHYLSHLDESKRNPLDSICYMWWDIFPFWGSVAGHPKFDDLFLLVMEKTLKLKSVACQESALHGLGHIPSHRDHVYQIISQFLSDNPYIRPELREYALNAISGYLL